MSLRARLAAFVIFITVGSLPVQAMSLRTHFTIMAFSEDGKSALVHAAVGGPEGGGQSRYEIWSASSPHRARIEVSSDLSQGGSAKPQTITAAACADALKALDATLRKRGFKGVTVHADKCGKREGLVVVDPPHGKEIETARYRALGNKLARDGIEVRFRGSEIGMYKDEIKLCAIAQPKRDTPAELAVGGPKGGKLIYVIETTSQGDQGLLGLCGVGEGEKLQLLPLEEK